MNPAELLCMSCGQTKTKDISLLLTECAHLFCSLCCRPDIRGHATCRSCRRKCRTIELKGNNPPALLRTLLQDPINSAACFLRANEMQTRWKNFRVHLLRQRVDKSFVKNQALDKETSYLASVQKKAEKFLDKMERSFAEAKNVSPKFAAVLKTFSEIDSDDLDDFLTNFSDTSDSTSADESESQSDAESVKDWERAARRSRQERPDNLGVTEKQRSYLRPRPDARDERDHRVFDDARDRQHGGKVYRERRSNARRPTPGPDATMRDPRPSVSKHPGRSSAKSRDPRFDHQRSFGKRHTKHSSSDSQPMQPRKPGPPRGPNRHSRKESQHESNLNENYRRKSRHRESSHKFDVPRRRKYDLAFAE